MSTRRVEAIDVEKQSDSCLRQILEKQESLLRLKYPPWELRVDDDRQEMRGRGQARGFTGMPGPRRAGH